MRTFRLCSDGVKLMVETPLESEQYFAKSKKILTKRNWEVFTHDMPGSRPLKVLLRGTDDMPVEKVAGEQEGCELKPKKIHKMQRYDKER